MAVTFSLFPNLPPELRDQIWREALPDDLGPAVFFYKIGCWRPRRLTESDEGYLPGHDDTNNMELRFCHNLLDDGARVNVPIFYVSREARRIALAWFHKEGVRIRSLEDGRLLFVRPFDPQRDVLYVPDNRWRDFCAGGSDRFLESDMFDRSATIESEPERLAVSENLFAEDQFNWLPEAMGWHDHLRDVLVVQGEQPNQKQGLWRWELGGFPGVKYTWNDNDQEVEIQEGNESFSSDVDLRIILGQGEFNELINMGISPPKIRFVSIVEK
ncbi:hypothetical protein F5Y13DRAFT_152365 [Hypoxylon sp. FL1857]|nr:hypothetical protein F5Y13DRAFT_152365 [Hypoxylon sp. FL1857]